MTPPLPTARPPSKELIRANLIFERARAGLSQTALAEAAGVTRQTVSDIERSAGNPTVDILDRIVAALGITIDKLFIQHTSALAVDEAAGREPKRYSSAGRPRLDR